MERVLGLLGVSLAMCCDGLTLTLTLTPTMQFSPVSHVSLQRRGRWSWHFLNPYLTNQRIRSHPFSFCCCFLDDHAGIAISASQGVNYGVRTAQGFGREITAPQYSRRYSVLRTGQAIIWIIHKVKVL
jgi:hypothetical protein